MVASRNGGETSAVRPSALPEKFAVLCGLDFEPEDRPERMIEAVFLADADTSWLAGLYELRFVRPLTADEWKARKYREIIATADSEASSGQAPGGEQ